MLESLGKGFGNVFLKVWKIGNDVITHLKVWFFIGNMFWKRVGKPGKLFVEKLLFFLF